MKQSGIFIICALLVALTACTGKPSQSRVITVTIEPQRYFAEKIAGDKFVIHAVVPSGQSPETYDPTPKQMVDIGQSRAYLRIGYIGFEQVWMKKIESNNPNLKVFDMSEGMKLVTDTAEEHHHDEAEDSHHHHGGIDPHIWNSVEGAKVIAWNMLNAFINLDRGNTAYYWKNYKVLLNEIENTEATLKQLLTPLAGQSFIIYHPALTYFAAEFGLKQLCLEIDGKEPSPLQLKELVEMAKANHTHTVFIQQEFDQKNAELIAKETGCRLVAINPLDYNWSKELIRIAKVLADGQTH
jgi:zinc transport system substrate-binding protein